MKKIKPLHVDREKISARLSNVRSKSKVVLPPVAKRFKKPTLLEQTEEALQNVPRITNETIAEHREEVLKGARKYKYPLQHSKHRIIVVSLSLLTVALVVFTLFSLVSLYKVQSTSALMYRVTQIVPLPVAKAGRNWVSYESYLFEMRRYMHYYQTQQQVDFASETGQLQLAAQKPKALRKVVDASYVKQLAAKNGVSVKDSEVRDQLDVLRLQNQLAGGDQELASVAKRFYNWSLDDLRRELKQELLAQKLVAKLDAQTRVKAENTLAQLRGGGDFGTLAAQLSDDVSTKNNAGQYADTAITISSLEVPPAVVRQLQKMQPGEVSPVIETPTAFEIVKLIETNNGKFKAAHIAFNYRPLQDFLTPYAEQHKAKYFISLPAPDKEAVPQNVKPPK